MRRPLMLLSFLLALPRLAADDPPPAPAAPAADDLHALHTAVERELREGILPWWIRHVKDPRGGFFGEVTNDLAVRRDAPRGALLTSRILWTYSAAYRRYRDPACLEMARWAYADLTTRFADPVHGGFHWSTKADGTPAERHKHIYGQSFAIYALSEFARATGEREPLDRAIALYRLLETVARDRQHGGYREGLDEAWTPSMDVQRRTMGPGEKSQNAHLHIMEAYTNLLRAWPDDGLRRDLRDLIDVMLERIVDPQTHHLRLFLTADWKPVSDEISYGHDIEVSWLLPEAAEVVGEAEQIRRVNAAAVRIAAATLAEGVDADGAVLYEGGPRGVTATNKDWWPQAEALVGFLNAYQLTGDPKFLGAARRSWEFIAARIVDPQHGEWFWGVTRGGRVLPGRAKATLWKCPYHNGRACLEVTERLERLLGAGAR